MKQFSVLSFLAVFVCFITINTGCKRVEKKENKLEFYYFPEKNIYYDVAKKDYLYSLDGGKTWSTIKSPLNEDQASLGKKEIIYTDTDSIWLNNEAHRKLYSGSTFNIIDDDTSTVASANDIAEKKVVKKTKHRVIKRPSAGNEKKQPVKDFFRKLFGKHKKEDR